MDGREITDGRFISSLGALRYEDDGGLIVTHHSCVIVFVCPSRSGGHAGACLNKSALSK